VNESSCRHPGHLGLLLDVSVVVARTGQDGNGYPETRVPDGFYPLKRRVRKDFSNRGYVNG
jgi:hypothetical protein